MNKQTRFVLVAIVIVLAFDTISALVSKMFGIHYEYFSIVQILIYGIAGFFAAHQKSSLLAATAVGGILGFIESTVGWAISWQIGPGKIGDLSDATTISATAGAITEIILTIVFVTILAAITGLLGGLAWKLKSRLMPSRA